MPTFSYPRFVKLLQLSCYSKYVLSGLVISVGGLQDSLRKASLTALLEYLQALDTQKQTEKISREVMLSTDILWVLQQYKRCDRVIIPALKVSVRNCATRITKSEGTHGCVFFLDTVVKSYMPPPDSMTISFFTFLRELCLYAVSITFDLSC